MAAAASTNLNEILVGPWGGSGGGDWDFKPKGTTTQIDIMIYNDVIRSLTFTSKNANGIVENELKVGSDGGSNAGQVIINAPSEYLTGVSGTVGKYQDMVVLNSLKFHTNVTKYGPYGTDNGTPFSFVIQDGEIIGFHGRAGWYVDAIGVYMVQKPIQVGPWGGPGGGQWDFMPKEMIKQIDIMVYNDVIRSLTITSKGADGTVDAVMKVGSDGGTKAGQVSISDPSEYLIGMSGTIGNYQSMVMLSSLKFYTNMNEYGPYGTDSGKQPFSFVLQDGKIVGFHGQAGWYVDAIGAYVASK